MAVSVQPKIAGLDVLESGLRTLKRSKLLVTPEYKDMLFAVERHHNDLRLAHLTGKAKDLLEQAQRDTKFYNILVKMLCEVKEKRTGEQRQGLRRVYTWYMANKHVLYTGPHFGKEQLKKEAHEVLVKASTPRKAKSTHTKSTLTSRTGSSQSQARAAGQKSRAKSAPSTRITWRDSSFDWRKDLEKGVVNQEQPKVERLNLQDDHDDNDTIEPELQRLAGDTDTAHNTPLNTADTATTANTELLREARRLSRAHHESPTTPMTPLGEQSPNVEVSSVTPAKMIHSISSMVNPHVTLSLQLEQQRQEKQQAQRRMGEKQSRAHSLQAWQNFNKNRSYGQDIVDRLNFVGRSGTPNDVRYFAHGQAEMPELYTSDVITGYAQVMAAQTALTDDGSRPDDQKENVFVHQTLEQFYETADSLYPSSDHRPMSRSPRVKSAPVAGRMSSRLSKAGLPATAGSDSPKRRVSGHPPRLGHMLQDFTVQEEVTELKGQGEQTTVKLDTVINIIDSVSEEMTLYKERLAPEAQAGFRQPVATGLPVGASSPPSVRLPSPVARSNSPVQEQTAEPLVRQPAPPRPYSSPSLLSRQAMMREGLGSATTSPRLPKDRCKSAGVIDWRGRVQPDTTRYKWGKTKFGGYTYLKKHLQRPSSLRTAGSTSAGRRPKTAPVSIREKWKTERASDANSRVEGQAASNSMTQINQQDVDSMMTVHYLLGSSNSRADSMASLFSLDEEFLRNFHRRHNVPSSAPPMEYMSFVASSPAALLQAERRSTSHDLAHQDTFDERPRPEAGNEGADYIPLPPNLDDLHLPLDDLIAENNNDDDDGIAGEAGEEEELLDDHLEEKREDKEEDGAEGKQEEGQQTGTKPDVITSDVSNAEHDPVEATSDRLPAEEASDVLLSQNTTAGTEVTSDKAEVIANVPTAVEDTISNEQAPVYGSSEVTPANDLVDVTPVSDPTLTTSDHDSAKATCVSISTQVTQVYDQSETELTSALSDKDQAQTEVKGITSVTFITPDSKSPLPGSSRQSHRQPLSVSQVWQFSPSEYDDEEDGLNPNFILGPSGAPRVGSARPAQRRKVYCSDCISMASTETATVPKIQRSAGRMPTQAYSTSAPPLLHFTRRHDELMRRVPPPRTPPSIPMPKAHSLKKERSPRGRPMMTELEHHARKVKSPRALMQHVKDLRSSGDMQETPRSNASTADSLMSTLQVCRLQIPLPRQRTVPLLQSSGSDRDCLHSILKQPSEHTIIIPHQQELYSNDIAEGTQPTEKVVTFSQDDSDFNKDSQPENTSTEFFANGLPMPDSMGFMRQFASEVSSLHSSGSVSLHNSLPGSRHTSEPGTPSNRNLAHVGRPIPQVAHIPDPDEVAVAVQKQKEAAAAVDIQRLFRGYVARNIYKKLLTEERATAEDKQRAAVEIQRMYRGHLSRRRAIKHRAPNKEMLEWAHNYRQVLLANEHNRQAKAEERAEQLASNYHNAQSKLSVIGPHVNIYEIYHPKKTGPSKKELNVAAIAIQRWIRGWLIRRRFDKLKRKAAWYGSTFEKLVKEYKAMLSRVQSQHGMNNPKIPFTTREMNDYIDIRRRYECIFEKKAFGGELELADVPSFFKECDLFPSQAEIDEALDVAVRGVEGRGLKRHEMLNMVFYIYTPSATGLQNTRQSTWMNPIIDGIEAKRLIGSEFVEDAPLEVCAQLVIESRRERREKEQAEEQARSEAEDAELRRQMAASRRRVSREGREKEKVEGKTKEEKEEK